MVAGGRDVGGTKRRAEVFENKARVVLAPVGPDRFHQMIVPFGLLCAHLVAPEGSRFAVVGVHGLRHFVAEEVDEGAFDEDVGRHAWGDTSE